MPVVDSYTIAMYAALKANHEELHCLIDCIQVNGKIEGLEDFNPNTLGTLGHVLYHALKELKAYKEAEINDKL